MNTKVRIFAAELARNHPACDGHFDGNPLLPGVVTLEYVRLACKEFYPDLLVKSFKRVKFTHSLKPGEKLKIHLAKMRHGLLDFQCFDSKQHQIAVGTLRAE